VVRAAQAHDELTGALRWRGVDHSNRYDYAQIRLRLDRIRNMRARHDHHGLLFTLNEGIHGNMGGMGSHSLYQRAKFGTKRLIEQYINEIDDGLRFLADLDTDALDAQEKIDFFYRSNICYGRSALMLSGGGVLGFHHLGVVKTLLEEGLLPRVISGSSAGSLVAGVLGTHSDTELEPFYDPAKLTFEAEREVSLFSRLFFGAKPMIDAADLDDLVNRLIPDMTFQEAYEKTGRQISISIAPAELHQTSRLLNAITSPNVYVRSAVMASCAVPGVFPPVMLLAKNSHGESQPYLPDRKWVDGSFADDLPAKRLKRLYSTNHFIVSMVNPIATPFLKRSGEGNGLLSAVGAMGMGMGREMLNLYRGMVQKRNHVWPRFNMLVSSIHSVIDQDYSGDINIVPDVRWYNPAKMLSHLSQDDLLELINAGQRSTYPAIEAIRSSTKVSRTLEEILSRFEKGELVGVEKKAVKKPRSSRRRPQPTRAKAKDSANTAAKAATNKTAKAKPITAVKKTVTDKKITKTTIRKKALAKSRVKKKRPTTKRVAPKPKAESAQMSLVL